MNPINFLSIVPLLVALVIPAIEASAQDAPIHTTSVAQASSQAKLKADLVTPADKKDKIFYTRTVTRSEDGTYYAVILDQNAQLRMKGTYLDENCHVANGVFTYYYANGTIESTGEFLKGFKTGTWYCYQENGSPRAERFYRGMNWEDQAVALGLASRAASLDAPPEHIQ